MPSSSLALTSSTDADVIERSLREPDLFVEIFERHGKTVIGFLQRQFAAHVAEEIAAETFAIAFDRRIAFDQAYAGAKPWLFGIAINVARRYRHEERRQAWLAVRSEHGDDGGRHEDRVIDRADADAGATELLGALRSLKRGDREALLLLAWAGMHYDEIAVALAIPVGTVRSRIHRARRQIKHKLAGTPIADRFGGDSYEA